MSREAVGRAPGYLRLMDQPNWLDVTLGAIALLALAVSGVAAWYGRKQTREAQEQTRNAAEALALAERQTALADQQTRYAAEQLELAKQVHIDSVQPYLFAEIAASRHEIQALVIRVVNNGTTAAKNVQVAIDPPIKPHDTHPLSGFNLTTLAPGGIYERFIEVVMDYYASEAPRRFTITATGEGPFGVLDPSVHVTDLNEWGEMLGTEAPDVQAAKHLKNISDSLRPVRDQAKALIAERRREKREASGRKGMTIEEFERLRTRGETPVEPSPNSKPTND